MEAAVEQSAPPQPAPVAAQPQPAPVAAQQVAQPPPQQQQEPLQPLKLTGQPTQEFVEQLQQSLLQASWLGVHALRQVLPTALCHRICTQVTPLLKKEPTLLELDPAGQCVSVVGDTHGHFHDLCHLLTTFGPPSSERIYIFNGDFVDRGSWGVETIMLLLTYKWLYPKNVYLIRGNHETAYCTKMYGFKGEIYAKYGEVGGKKLYKDIIALFANLPLAALVNDCTLILHGGLFRSLPPKKLKNADGEVELVKHLRDLNRLAPNYKWTTGDLNLLRASGKGGLDPDPDTHISQVIASDVLWSDPSHIPGHIANELRGVGTRFGPDTAEAFMCANNIRLIIRSHEGPDARVKRPADDIMPGVDSGYSVDLAPPEVPSGTVMTVFSAPCYPMFSAEGETPNTNKGAVCHLTAPDYATPELCSFEAVLPRPQSIAFYDTNGTLSDSETTEETAGGETASVTSVGRSTAADAEDCATSRGTAVQQPPAQEQQQQKQEKEEQEQQQTATRPRRSTSAAAAAAGTSNVVCAAAAKEPLAADVPAAVAVFGAAVAGVRSPKRARSCTKK